MDHSPKKKVLLGLPGSFQGEYVPTRQDEELKQKLLEQDTKKPIWLQPPGDSPSPKTPIPKIRQSSSRETPLWLKDGSKVLLLLKVW